MITTEYRGHGHVTPRADGVRFVCGGPGRCPVCIDEQLALDKAAAVRWCTPEPVDPPEAVDKIKAAREALLGKGWVLPE